MVFRSIGIRGRLIAMVITALLFSVLAASLLIRDLVYENIIDEKITTADILAASLVHDVKYEYNYRDQIAINSIISKYLTYYRTIKRIHYYTIDDDSIVGYTQTNDNVTLFDEIPANSDQAILDAVNKARPSNEFTRLPSGEISIRSLSPVLQGSKVIGAIETVIATDDINDILAAIYQRMLVILVIVSVLAIAFLYFALHSSLLSRLSRLMAATSEVSTGNYNLRLNDNGTDEMGELARAFDQMMEDLRISRAKIENHNEIMDRKVKDATAELSQAYEDLKNAQGQIVLSEKMASLGVLIAGIAHEINTPIGSISNISRNLEEKVASFPELIITYDEEQVPAREVMAEVIRDVIRNAFEISGPPSFKQTRAIENTLKNAGVTDWRSKASTLASMRYTNIESIEKYAACFESPWLFQLMQILGYIAHAAKISETSSQKIHDIIRALKFYAYTDQDKVEATQISDSVKTSLVLINSRIKHKVELDTEFESGLPLVPCNSEIHQIWTVLLNNALDAIEERQEAEGGDYRGSISVQTFREGDSVNVRITDNGGGIPDDMIEKIYDPFFTTKDIGQGTGLGLSIVTGIIKKHGGNIEATSAGDQTTFLVSIPVAGIRVSSDQETEKAVLNELKP